MFNFFETESSEIKARFEWFIEQYTKINYFEQGLFFGTS